MLLLSDGAMQSLVKALQSYFAVLRQATPSYDTTHLHLQLQPSISNPFRLKAHLLPSKWPITPFCERIYEVVSYIATSSGRAVHQWLATHSYRTFPSTILILHWCVRLTSSRPQRNQLNGTFAILNGTFAIHSQFIREEENNKQPIRDFELSASQASIQGIEE